MFDIQLHGLEKLQKNLSQLEKNAKALDGKHEVPLEEVLTSAFLRRNTNFHSLDEIMDKVKVKNQKDFKELPDEDLDKIIQKGSSFSSWQEMLQKAGGEYAEKRLFKGV